MTAPAPPLPGVRRADARDLDLLVAFWIELTAHHERIDPRFALREGAQPEVRELLRAMLRDPGAAAFVHEQGGEPDGFCLVRIDRAPPIHAETHRAEITDLAVRASARRRGVGRALALAALGFARERGASRVEVRVLARNRQGRAFWRALGFGAFVDVLERRL